MTEQKTLTFMEAIAEARKGAVIGIVDGPVMYWDSLSEILKFHSDDVEVAITSDILDRRYHIIDPAPKPKVKVALYVYKHRDAKRPNISGNFISAKDALETYGHSDIDWFKRLDWSEIEVDK